MRDMFFSPIRRTSRCLLLLALTMGLAACGLPNDPSSTTEKVRGGVLHVGVVESPPWLVRSSEAPHAPAEGVDAELVKQFAADMDADIVWYWGSVREHAQALRQFELHLGAGNFTSGDPTLEGVATTRPYRDVIYHIGHRPGVDDSTPGAIAVQRGSGLADAVDAAGYEVKLVRRLTRQPWVAARRDWLQQHGYVLPEEDSDDPLLRSRQVFALPPGENAFLMQMDTFLRQQKSS